MGNLLKSFEKFSWSFAVPTLKSDRKETWIQVQSVSNAICTLFH